METSLIVTLQDYGLSEKEAKIYLTILELGSAPVGTIARRSNVKRTTVYTTIEEMKKKGIVNEVLQNDIKYYSVIAPEILEKQLKQKYNNFKDKLPDFLSIAEKYGNKPRTQFFEGVDGLKKMYHYLLDSKEPIRSFLGAHEVNEELRDYLNEDFVPQRVANKIRAKVLLCDTPENHEYRTRNAKNLIETITIDHELFHFANGIDIHGGDKVSFVMFTNDEMSGLIINSPKLHDMLASIFDFIWATQPEGKE